MKVKELIKELCEWSPDTEVIVITTWGGVEYECEINFVSDAPDNFDLDRVEIVLEEGD